MVARPGCSLALKSPARKQGRFGQPIPISSTTDWVVASGGKSPPVPRNVNTGLKFLTPTTAREAY